jgi:hypothetical protein
MICKICNKEVPGDGYCGEHSSGGSNYGGSNYSEELEKCYDIIENFKVTGVWEKLNDYFFKKYHMNKDEVTDYFIDNFIKINKI